LNALADEKRGNSADDKEVEEGGVHAVAKSYQRAVTKKDAEQQTMFFLFYVLLAASQNKDATQTFFRLARIKQ
jgi:hypothetical protein